MENSQQINPISNALDDERYRKALRKTFAGFCLLYLPHHFNLAPGNFHQALMAALSDDTIRFLEVVGFRGSAKSTLGSLAFPLYAALEKPKRYPFIIPVADTGLQASINVANIKTELDNNTELRRDYGELKVGRAPAKPKAFRDSDDAHDYTLESAEEWQSKNMLLSNGVRILARSRGQKVRGLKHRQHRPKLIIVDDPEDTEWVRSKESRDKTEKWLRGEVMPAMDEVDGRLIIIGNFLHNDAIMARAEKWGIFFTIRIPLLDDAGVCAWPDKYPTKERLAEKRKELGEVAWMREMLLKVVPDEGQEIVPEDIQYYNEMPNEGMGNIGHGVDLAISEKSSADYTTDVVGKVFYVDGRARIYIQPKPLNARLDILKTIEHSKAQTLDGQAHIFFVEDVAYQKAAIQLMEANMIPVHPMRPITDKRARLRSSAPHIRNGTVLFPRTGCEDLLNQLFGFGVEKHDDLVDGLTNLILGFAEHGLELPKVVWI